MRSLLSLATPLCGCRRVVAIVCVATLLGVVLPGAQADAQSDASVAPWQLPPREWTGRDAAPVHASRPSGARVERTAYDADPQPMPQPVQRKGAAARPAQPQDDSRYDAQYDAAPIAGPTSQYEGDAGSCNSCGNGGCDVDGGQCGPCFSTLGNRYWFRGEYLAWWTKADNVPVLVTTSPVGTPQAQAGVLGQPNTTILFGGDSINEGVHSGGRFTFGTWLGPCGEQTGVEAVYTFLNSRGVTFDQTSQSFPILARPFYNVQTALEDASLVAFPNLQTGSINVRTSNELQSFELLVRSALVQQSCRRIDFLYGYRYGRFTEDLAINASTTSTGTQRPIPVGTIIQVGDDFSTSNEFNGFELGISTEERYCAWTVELMAKLALGSTHSSSNVNGTTVTTVPGQTPVTNAGGLLALPTNIGTLDQNAFSVVPELGVTLGYDLTCRLKATFGYTFLYFSHAVRAGDQVNDNLNTSQLPPNPLTGLPVPQHRLVVGDFWAQGINLGLDYRF